MKNKTKYLIGNLTVITGLSIAMFGNIIPPYNGTKQILNEPIMQETMEKREEVYSLKEDISDCMIEVFADKKRSYRECKDITEKYNEAKDELEEILESQDYKSVEADIMSKFDVPFMKPIYTGLLLIGLGWGIMNYSSRQED